MSKRSSVEHWHQVRIVNFLRDRGHICFAVPNAAKRSYALAAYLKQEGVTAGTPDIIIVTPPPKMPGYHCAIETKAEQNFKISPSQKVMHEKMRGDKWIVIVATGHVSGIRQLQEIGY